jgi:hypothetical protein
MSEPSRRPSDEFTGPWEWRILALSGLVALLPYAVYHAMFARLYWFGDEFDLIDQIDRLGFWHWMWLAFAENFVPLFKLLWGGSVLVFGGSCAAMIAICWLTHALNVALLGRLMRLAGLSWAAVIFAQLLFGLTSANIETLAWSVQWSAVLAATFMLLALNSAFRRPLSGATAAWSAASALSFSRGVLTGILAAGALLLPGGNAAPGRRSRRLILAGACIAPSLAVAFLIAVMVPAGNQGHMAGHWGEAAVFAAWYYCLNPAYHLLGVESWGPRTAVLLGILKVALVAWSLARSTGPTRKLFLVLLAFDLGNAALLGIGRYHTGLPATVSSRYQYAALIAVLPAAGFLFSRLWDRVPGPGALRRAVLGTLVAAAAWGLCSQWLGDLGGFTTWRGTESRRILITDPNPDPHAVPGFPGFPTQRAKYLIAKYNLH